MKITKIKKKIKDYNFLCLGACHKDNILKLKKEYKLFRTNPVNTEIKQGGVCANIANNLSFFSKNIHFFSLKLTNKQKEQLIKKKFNYYNISNVKNDCFYSAILENNGKLLLGLASNKTYESINKIDFIKINNKLKKNSFFILDLCFNLELTQKIINYYSKKKINIFVAGTSSFKIYRIKKLLNKISALSLNEDEISALTNKRNINDSIKYILRKNPNIYLVITRGTKPVIMIYNQIKYIGYVPLIKVKNENGAGDAFAAMFFLSIASNFSPITTLSLSITLGCINAMDYKYTNMIDYNKMFELIYKKITIKKNVK